MKNQSQISKPRSVSQMQDTSCMNDVEHDKLFVFNLLWAIDMTPEFHALTRNAVNGMERSVLA